MRRRLERHGGVFNGPHPAAEGLSWSIELPLNN
jgi:hypothetical protein